LVEFTINGHGPGEPVEFLSPGPVEIRVAAESVVPFERVEVLCNSAVVASAAATKGERFAATISQPIPIVDSSWLAVRCVGPAGSVLYPAAPAFAHTSPVVVRVGGGPLPRRPAATEALRREVEKVKNWADTVGRYVDSKWKAQLLARCDEALARLG
jgi:hypothetical protein